MATPRIVVILLPLILGLLQVYPAEGQTIRRPYWVYFVDKGNNLPSGGSIEDMERVKGFLTQRSLQRRAKVLLAGKIIDAADFPVSDEYINRIKHLGGILRQRSRWLNAASFLMTADQTAIAAKLPFVDRLAPVVVLHGRGVEQLRETSSTPFTKGTLADYGQSRIQNEAINVLPLHDLGITGHDVRIGMLDTGFRWRIHESLNTRKVVAEHDFIFNDDTTANQASDRSDQDQHGTLTMSTIGGYKIGQLIGPAFDAEFVLGKTEYVPSETQIEEDYWAAAIEWMEGLGVDVVSSSLGYNIFDDGSGYQFSNGDFDGRTSVTAKAAIRAARLGVVISTAAGNEGNGNGIKATLLTPADADSIIAVGATTFAGSLADFSSTGPTNDGRFKPDVVAPGVDVFCASTTSPNSYSRVDGTSLATPLVGGAAALLLSARPELTPVQVRDVLRNTAVRIDTIRFPARPNNFTGWGMIDAFNAALSFGPIFANRPEITAENSTVVIRMKVASKFGIDPSKVFFQYRMGESEQFSAITMVLDSSMTFPTSGRYKTELPLLPAQTIVQFYIDASDSSFNAYRSPAAVTGKLWEFNSGITSVHTVAAIPSKFGLDQNYPNPFNPQTTIRFSLPHETVVSLTVYNALGQEVRDLVSGIREAGTLSVTFDGEDLPSGVYYYRLVTPSFSATKKMIILR